MKKITKNQKITQVNKLVKAQENLLKSLMLYNEAIKGLGYSQKDIEDMTCDKDSENYDYLLDEVSSVPFHINESIDNIKYFLIDYIEKNSLR